MSPRQPKCPALMGVAAALLFIGVGCAARTPHLLLRGAPQELRTAHDALLRAHRGEAAFFAPKELAEARRCLSQALSACAAAPSGACRAGALSYSVRRQVQLAESLAGQRASQARAGDLQQALTALQEAAASDAWDTGDAQSHLALAVPPAPWPLLQVAAREASGGRAGECAEAIDIDVAELFDEASSTLTARGALFTEAIASSAAARPPGSAALCMRLHASPRASRGLTLARCLALAAYLRAQGTRLHCVGVGCSIAGPATTPSAPMLWHIQAAAAR